jgi:hypothetical protein
MANNTSYSSRSADVTIELRFNGTIIPVAQLGPDFLILDDPVEHPSGEAEIVLRVDENEQRWPVFLPDGLSRDRQTIRIRNH